MSNQDLPPLAPPGGSAPVPAPAPLPASYYPPYPVWAPHRGAARPPAEPSTGTGWTVVALLSWWPLGIAAYSHSQRAAVALASGDRPRAEAEAAKARRAGIAGLVVSVALSVLLAVALVAGTLTLLVRVIDAQAAARAESSTSYVADDAPGSGPADGTLVRDLRPGTCYLVDGLTEVVRTVSVVPCDEPHGGEMYHRGAVPSDAFGVQGADALPEYPGDAETERYVDEACRAAFENETGTSVEASGLHYWYVAPDAWDWRAQDRTTACLVESGADDLTGRVGDR